MLSERRNILVGGGVAAAALFAAYISRKPLIRAALSVFSDNTNYLSLNSFSVDPVICRIATQSIEGPYFVPDSPFRRDIQDGQVGAALHLKLKFVDALTCKPLPNIAIHVWQANANGTYSSYFSHSPDEVESTPGHVPVENTERFLRGHQITNAEGSVDFFTIYPAWYSFRTPHIHLKALIDEKTLLTTQLYFPDSLNKLLQQTVYLTVRGQSLWLLT